MDQPAALASPLFSNPPLHRTFKTLLDESSHHQPKLPDSYPAVAADPELPTIDLAPLLEGGDSGKTAECKGEIARASAEWGLFRIVNHGISDDLLGEMRMEQEAMFNRPFEEKKICMGAVARSGYHWGGATSGAKSLSTFSWYEAFHIPIAHLDAGENSSMNNLRSMREYARKVTDLATKLIQALAEELLGRDTTFFHQNCNTSTCFLRLNKYPPCPAAPDVYGLRPHTDGSFITILYQDRVGGLQLVKDGEWVNVEPKPEALIVNIGDLLELWSNGAYKSVEHRVVTNRRVERHSVAYLVCPLRESVIRSESEQPRIYRTFTYGEYRDQADEEIRNQGIKFGPAKILLPSYN